MNEQTEVLGLIHILQLNSPFCIQATETLKAPACLHTTSWSIPEIYKPISPSDNQALSFSSGYLGLTQSPIELIFIFQKFFYVFM